MDNLKDFKNEALVVTNASDGNTPHIVQGIEPDGSLRTKPVSYTHLTLPTKLEV